MSKKNDNKGDLQASARKKDHINLTGESQVDSSILDDRFFYEPLLGTHRDTEIKSMSLAGKSLKVPLWVSSMTGGTAHAKTINKNLAQACAHFGMGMGLGSCRQLLHSDEYLEDFNVRPIIGDDLPLFANLGIAQLEELVREDRLVLVSNVVEKLQVDGLIVHVNPMQEWLQPEGDRFMVPAIQTIRRLIENLDVPIIVKEVGQGMGPESLESLMQLPIEAVDFAAGGGTNFAKLELHRADEEAKTQLRAVARLGHDAAEMVDFTNAIHSKFKGSTPCKKLIISGGVKGFLDGYYLMNKSLFPSIYGQASSFLKRALLGEEALFTYIEKEIEGLRMSHQFLRIRK